MILGRALAACVAMLCAGVAQAEAGLGVDFEALFADHASQVERSEDADGTARELLRLPGPVLVTRDAAGGIVAIDRSEYGAVGCFALMLAEVAGLDSACPGLLPPEEKARLGRMTESTLGFVAENTYPRSDRVTVGGRFDAMVTTIARGDASFCAAAKGEETARFLRNFLGARTEAGLAKMLSVPRLPVDKPCL